MFDRRRLKKHARKSLKQHYFYFLILLLFASIIGTSNTIAMSAFDYVSPVATDENVVGVGRNRLISGFDTVYEDIIEGNLKSASDTANEQQQIVQESGIKIGGFEIGRKRGIFAMAVNSVSSGSILLQIIQAITNITQSTSIATSIFIVLSLLVLLLIWIFFVNVYRVIYKRIFLEGRMYKEVPLKRMFFLLRVKKWSKASLTMLVTSIYELLWDLTIIGGFVKHYSYFLVPYIVAENPSLSPNEAITLSRKMMYGHKWEFFKLDITFLPWDILSYVTVGILNILFVTPYKEATYAEYYVYVHNRCKEQNTEGIEKLQDIYLYKVASKDIIDQAYGDVIHMMNAPKIEVAKRNGISAFFANTFGLIWHIDDIEVSYRDAMLIQHKIDAYKQAVAQNRYPSRLNPTPEKDKEPLLESTEYYRHYTLLNLILIFFIVCIIGWCFEAVMGFVSEGEFVNRGMLHGPWLPIYGSGGIVILLLLFRFRENPAKEFSFTILVCGILEYMTGWILELTHNGLKWWDYSGYFLNINGRVCAEGLLAFGVGGFAIVYALAPLLDNILLRMNKKVLIPICVVLVACFGWDVAYSTVNPNVGAGITDAKSLQELNG